MKVTSAVSSCTGIERPERYDKGCQCGTPQRPWSWRQGESPKRLILAYLWRRRSPQKI